MSFLIYYTLSVLISLYAFYSHDKKVQNSSEPKWGFLFSLAISLLFGIIIAPIYILFMIAIWDWTESTKG